MPFFVLIVATITIFTSPSSSGPIIRVFELNLEDVTKCQRFTLLVECTEYFNNVTIEVNAPPSSADIKVHPLPDGPTEMKYETDSDTIQRFHIKTSAKELSISLDFREEMEHVKVTASGEKVTNLIDMTPKPVPPMPDWVSDIIKCNIGSLPTTKFSDENGKGVALSVFERNLGHVSKCETFWFKVECSDNWNNFTIEVNAPPSSADFNVDTTYFDSSDHFGKIETENDTIQRYCVQTFSKHLSIRMDSREQMENVTITVSGEKVTEFEVVKRITVPDTPDQISNFNCSSIPQISPPGVVELNLGNVSQYQRFALLVEFSDYWNTVTIEVNAPPSSADIEVHHLQDGPKEITYETDSDTIQRFHIKTPAKELSIRLDFREEMEHVKVTASGETVTKLIDMTQKFVPFNQPDWLSDMINSNFGSLPTTKFSDKNGKGVA